MTRSRNGKDVMGDVDSVRDELKGNQKGLEKIKEEMGSQMEEGFKKEQFARQQIQNEMVQGFEHEENARQLVEKELAVVKEELKNLKMGNGSTVCSAAGTGVGLGSGTFARPPPLSARWNDIFFPRTMEFKGWITDYTLRVVLKE